MDSERQQMVSTLSEIRNSFPTYYSRRNGFNAGDIISPLEHKFILAIFLP